ncbi:MAG: hypothetical protein M0R80_12295 [Proteobacteria bacterium]|nr:hypothetical protein [Pseudomonadota bacterium]
MRAKPRLFGLLAAALVVAFAFATGCKKKEEPTATAVEAAPKGPDYQVFAPLKQATLEVKMPWVMGEGADPDKPCFKPVEDAQPAEADVVLKETVNDNLKGVKKAIVEWMIEVLQPDGLSRAIAESWTMSFEDVVAIEVAPDAVRFVDDPQCFGKSGWLPDGQHLATTVVGVKAIKFEANLPVGNALKAAIHEAAGIKSVVMESDALFDYSPAVDAAGQPLMDPDGKPLFNSPTGEYIGEAEVPPAEKRQMKEWTFKLATPLYVGVKELPKDAVRKESAKDKCDIIIIPDVPKPQPPECAEFSEVGFTVTILEGEEKPVSITMVVGDQNKGITLAWKEATKVQVNDRIILWIQPEKVEVGVNLKLNSLVLNPQPMAEGEGGGEPEYGEGGTFKSDKEVEKAKAEGKAAADEEKPAKGKKKDKAKAKEEEKAKEKPKKSSDKPEDALDNYLNQ